MSGIGELLAARIEKTGEPRLIVAFETDGRGMAWAIVVKPDGQLETLPLGKLSIDWHYDEKDGKWTPDFEQP